MAKSYKPKKIEKLDIEIVSKETKFWRDVRDKTLAEIEQMEQMIKFNKEIHKLAESKLSQSVGESPNK